MTWSPALSRPRITHRKLRLLALSAKNSNPVSTTRTLFIEPY